MAAFHLQEIASVEIYGSVVFRPPAGVKIPMADTDRPGWVAAGSLVSSCVALVDEPFYTGRQICQIGACLWAATTASDPTHVIFYIARFHI